MQTNPLDIFYHIEEIIDQHTAPYQIKFNLAFTPDINMGTIASNFILILKSKKVDGATIDTIVTNIFADFRKEWVESYSIVNNFFNITIKNEQYFNLIMDLQTRHEDNFFYITVKTKQIPLLHMEFGSINPTGPIHLGHLRAIIVAQCLCNLYGALKIPVFKEFFLNDCGFQIHQLLKSIYLRWQQNQGISVEDFPYKGAYVKDLIPSMEPDASLESMGQYQESIIETVKNKTLNQLQQLGVYYDEVTYESRLRKDSSLILKVFNLLIEKNSLGIMDGDHDGLVNLEEDVPIYGKNLMELPQGTVVLLTKNMGFEKHKVIMKHGDLTYFGADIIYLYQKFHRGFHHQYCFLGEDHIGHLTMLQKIAGILLEDLEFIPKKIGFVKVFNNGELVPMSKRQGKFLSMEDASQLIGLDFLKIIMISRNMNSELVFHITNAQDQNLKNNCLFYIQYCYARISSVLNKVHMEDYPFHGYDGQLLTEEKLILRQLFWMDWCFNRYGQEGDVNGIYQFIYDLATYFHSYFNVGSINPALKFITDDGEATAFRLHLLLSVKKTLGFLLKKIIGIEPLERM
jgi:arginyl-tRNA synthetase